MLSLVALTLLAQQPGGTTPQAPEPGILTVADALWSFEGISGPLQVVTGLSAEGSHELVLERGGNPSQSRLGSRIEAVALRTGDSLRTLWKFESAEDGRVYSSARERRRWDAQGDADGDTCSDVLIGLWREGQRGERCGRVVVVSGKDGAQLHRTEGDAALDGYGYCVAFVGDVNGDGHDDYAVGAPQAKVEEVVVLRAEVVSEVFSGKPSESTLVFKDGTRKPLVAYAQERLDARSSRAGYVSIRSGLDGTQLARFDGQRDGHGFGTRVCALGDLDGDGVQELAVAPANESVTDVQILSLGKREVIGRLPHTGGPLARVGDLNGDGLPDLMQANLERDGNKYRTAISVVAGGRWQTLFELPIPGTWSRYTRTSGLGDIDGDGFADIAIGEADFNIPAPNWPEGGPEAIELQAMSLRDALKLESQPHASLRWETGCVLVYSGRTQEAILGILGAPGVARGVGLFIAALPDADGDGLPDLLVTDQNKVYAFSGRSMGD